MDTLRYRIAGALATTLEACAALLFTVGMIALALGIGGRW